MTADQLVQKCKEAMGGVSRIDALQTLKLEVIYPNHSYPVYAEVKRPNLYRSQGGNSILLFDGTRCGMIKDFDPTGIELEPYLFPKADWNHACSVEVWFTTMSITIRIPRWCASASNRSKSSMVPNCGLIA